MTIRDKAYPINTPTAKRQPMSGVSHIQAPKLTARIPSAAMFHMFFILTE